MSAQPGHVSPGEHVDARLHATLRFATAVTLAFVTCEVMQWAPTFLAPALTVVLLGNLPMRPTPKLALVLFVSMAAAALYAFVVVSLLRGTPVVLFGLIALSLFLAFLAMLSGRPSLPFILLLICLATVPVVAMVAPAYASALPIAMVRGIAVALAMIGLVYLPWPRVPRPAPKPAAGAHEATPLQRALLSTAVVLPVMLVYLLFGLSDVLPVLVTTVMLVINFDLQSGRSQALGMILANFIGGLLGFAMHATLLTTPNLAFLTLLLFVVLLGFARRIVAGGPSAGVAVIACNAMLIIFSSAIASGPGSLALWLARVFQFALAGAFAVGMMHLLWHLAMARRAAPPNPAVH
ncbi:MAG TPA: DUF2955 domain-containing protein [Thermomonas sp.]|nr:DUF2955 domain-containing protein [Thermomonas sp.]